MSELEGEDPEWRPKLQELAALRAAGLLEPFALLDRVDEELAREYPAYRDEHRAELRRYVRSYYCGLE